MNQTAENASMTREELDAHYEKRQTPRGTYEQVNAQFEEFAELGLTRFYFQGVFTQTDTGRLLDGLGVH